MPLETIGQRFAADVRHHEVDGVLRLAEREQRYDCRVAQVRQCPRFGEKTGALVIAPGAIGVQNLDRDETMELALARQVHGTERAAA